MRIGVVAPGAVGGYFGGRLAQAGDDVAFVARGESLRALRDRGLRVDSVAGDFTVAPVEATDDPTEIGTVECVLVAVKAWQLPDVATAIRPMVGPDTFVVPLLNGVEAPAILAEAVGREHVLGGLCRIFAELVGPGHVRHSGYAASVDFGELDGGRSERAERLLAAFDRAEGVTASIPPDVTAAMWWKFLFIAPTSAVAAAARAPFGVIRRVPETRAMLEAAMREVLDVAEARGVALPPEVVERTMGFVDELMPEATASMQRDLMAGRPSELEGQTGAVVRLGREADVPVPVNDLLYATLLPQERAARGEEPAPEGR